jgi:hypothetical protein
MTDIRELLRSATTDAADLDIGALKRGAARRRARRLATAAVVIVLAGSASTVALTRVHGPNRRVVVAATTSTTGSTLPRRVTPAGGVALLPAPGLSPRSPAAVVSTGTLVAVWGGNFDAPNMGLPGPDRAFNDGAFYNSATFSWAPMRASPLPATRDQPVGASTTSGVVFARGHSTALWNPKSNTWRKLGDAPAPVTDLTFTGSEAVSYSADATLDVATGRWRSLPDAPAQLERATIAWTGKELVVVGGAGTPFTSASAIALDPSRRLWRQIADPPAKVHAEALAASWDGRRVVVVNYDMNAVAYDPVRDRWSTLPDVPARFSEWIPNARSANGYTVVFMAYAVVVLTPNDTWVPLPYGAIPFGIVASGHPAFEEEPAGGVLFVLGIRHGASVFVAVDPVRFATGPPRLQVGTGSVAVPRNYQLNAARYDTPSETVDITISAANNATCSVTSKYTNTATPDFAGLTPERLDNDGAAKIWHRNAHGTEWRTPPGSYDMFDVKCTDPSTARWLAGSASFKYPT